jgi:hypothetical protein
MASCKILETLGKWVIAWMVKSLTFRVGNSPLR